MTKMLPAFMRPSEGRTGVFLVSAMLAGFVALLIAGLSAYSAIGSSQRHTRWIVHTYAVGIAAAEAGAALERSEAARRGYLVASQPVYRARYDRAIAVVGPAIDRVDRLTRDNPAQQSNVRNLRRLVAELRFQHGTTNALVANNQLADADKTFAGEGDGQRIRAIRNVLAEMSREEQILLASREAELAESTSRFYIIVLLAAALFLFVAIVTLVTMLRYTRDIAASRDELTRVNDSLEDAVAERTGELRRANDEIQRFAYIVSHDLRSPLVNVMGFTAELETGTKALTALIDRIEATAPELVDENSRLAAREDLPEAIGFIRTSTAKMDRLIGAILKLSREGRRVIAPEAIDMHAMIDSIRATLQHRLDERSAEIRIQGSLPPVTSDRMAIDQVFSNVIENAVKYADPARPGRIVVSGRVDRGHAIFEIADNGRGIDPRDHGRVFDLFRRSGTQDQPGEGIGLAHVRALTYRLGGTIDVTSVLGEGATFIITLPIRFNANTPHESAGTSA